MDKVTDNPSRHRFELAVDNEVAFVTYAMEGNRLALLHTEVPKALEGRGVGKLLIRSVLDEARQRGLKIVPRCEFVSAFIERNPEFKDLIA
ncbi:MAG: GNAT family N-acetyltransferase [Methylovirgula sp.]